MTIIIKGENDYDYDSIPHLKLAGNPPSGKESRRTRKMLELRKRKGRIYTGNIEVRVNPAKNDATRSNRVFVLTGYERNSIKKID